MNNLSLILKTMNYRVFKKVWIKPFASTIIVIDFPEEGKIRMTQWFNGCDDTLCIWSSNVEDISNIIDIYSIQYLEMKTCKDAFQFNESDFKSLVPPLDLAQQIETIL